MEKMLSSYERPVNLPPQETSASWRGPSVPWKADTSSGKAFDLEYERVTTYACTRPLGAAVYTADPGSSWLSRENAPSLPL